MAQCVFQNNTLFFSQTSWTKRIKWTMIFFSLFFFIFSQTLLKPKWMRLMTVSSPSTLFASSVLFPPPKLQALVYDILPSTSAVFSYIIGSRKLSANEKFSVGAQTVVNLLQTTQIISDVCLWLTMLLTPAQIKTKIFWIDTELFFTRGGCVSCLRACFGTRLLLQSY